MKSSESLLGISVAALGWVVRVCVFALLPLLAAPAAAGAATVNVKALLQNRLPFEGQVSHRHSATGAHYWTPGRPLLDLLPSESRARSWREALVPPPDRLRPRRHPLRTAARPPPRTSSANAASRPSQDPNTRFPRDFQFCLAASPGGL